MRRRRTLRARGLAALAALGVTAGCGGPGAGASTAPEPSSGGPPVAVELRVRDVVAEDGPLVARAEIVLDGRRLRAAHGVLSLQLTPGAHVLLVRDPRHRDDLAALRFEGEAEPRAQAVSTDRLTFEVRPGDRLAELWVVPQTLDARFVVSLLHDGLSRRWAGPVDLHVDLSPSLSGWSLPPERVPQLAAFADSAVVEITGGALRLGRVTTGTGLEWRDFLEGERRGALTLQMGPLTARGPSGDVSGWAIYRERSRGVIRSANVFLSEEVLREGREEWRHAFGHELGHALGFQHPLPCRSWSRMAVGGGCPASPVVEPKAGTFWAPSDRAAGRLLYAFRPGTDLSGLAAAPR